VNGNNVIPDDVRRFVLNSIDSIAQLEALLIFRGNPETEWSVPTMAARLYIAQDQVAAMLTRMAADGFLIATDGDATVYRYLPRPEELAPLVDRLAEEYSRHLVAITKLIHAKQSMRINEFADAFKLRKDPS